MMRVASLLPVTAAARDHYRDRDHDRAREAGPVGGGAGDGQHGGGEEEEWKYGLERSVYINMGLSFKHTQFEAER